MVESAVVSIPLFPPLTSFQLSPAWCCAICLRPSQFTLTKIQSLLFITQPSSTPKVFSFKMVRLSVFLGLVAVSVNVHAAPILLSKRIAQVIADSTTKWEKACVRVALPYQSHTKLNRFNLNRLLLVEAKNATLSQLLPSAPFLLVQDLANSKTLPMASST
jgi:hypothetical protein